MFIGKTTITGTKIKKNVDNHSNNNDDCKWNNITCNQNNQYHDDNKDDNHRKQDIDDKFHINNDSSNSGNHNSNNNDHNNRIMVTMLTEIQLSLRKILMIINRLKIMKYNTKWKYKNNIKFIIRKPIKVTKGYLPLYVNDN